MINHEPRGKKIGIMRYPSIHSDKEKDNLPSKLYIQGLNSNDKQVYLEIQLSEDRLARMDQFACAWRDIKNIFRRSKEQIVKEIQWLEEWVERQ